MSHPKTWEDWQLSAQNAIGTMSDETADEAAVLAEAIDKMTEGKSNVAIMSAMILFATTFAKRCAYENGLEEEVACHGLGHVLHDAMVNFAPKATMFIHGKPPCVH